MPLYGMPKSQLVRFNNLAELPAGLAAHLAGDERARPAEAIARGQERAIDLGAEPERGRLDIAEALEARRAAKTGGRPPSQAVDVLFAGPPPYEASDAWAQDKIDAWAQDSITWLRGLLPPGTPLLAASIHTDERAPHGHAAFPPISPDGHGVASLSWKRTRIEMCERAGAGPLTKPSDQLRALQDSYHETVGKKHGLERGQRGAGIEYAPLDRRKGLEARAADTAARLAEAKDREAAEREARIETERRHARERDIFEARIRDHAVARAEEREKSKAETKRANAAAEKTADAERRAAAAADRKTAATEAAAAKDRAVLEHRVDREAERADAAESRTADAQRRADAAAEKTAATEAAAAKRRTVLERRVDREAKRADAAESKTADAQRHAAAADQDSSILRDTVQEYKIARSTERRRHQAAEAKTDRDRTTERHWTAATAARAGRQGYGQTPAPQIGQAPTRPTDRSHTPARRRQRGRGQSR